MAVFGVESRIESGQAPLIFREKFHAVQINSSITNLAAHSNRFVGSPVVALNRAVALGMAYGPELGLEAIEKLTSSGALEGYHLLPATRADLLRRASRFSGFRGHQV